MNSYVKAGSQKKGYTVSQLHLKRGERKKNLKGGLSVGDLSQISNGSTFLLVDDVSTTGSVLSELGKSIHSDREDI